jgi:hypothetical protein
VKSKIVLVYRDQEGNIAEETVWGEPMGDNFKVDNVPFFAPNLALDDIVSVELDDGVLYFDKLVTPSGHSTLQIIFFKEKEIPRVLDLLVAFGCSWEGMAKRPYYAVDIPPSTDYETIRSFLLGELEAGVLDFKEACLSERNTKY